MVINRLIESTRRQVVIPGTEVDGESVVVSYSPHAVTPAGIARINEVEEREGVTESDIIVAVFAEWSLRWNLTRYADPDELTGGSPAEIAIPVTSDALAWVSNRLLHEIYRAVLEDVRPKAESNTEASSAG